MPILWPQSGCSLKHGKIVTLKLAQSTCCSSSLEVGTSAFCMVLHVIFDADQFPSLRRNSVLCPCAWKRPSDSNLGCYGIHTPHGGCVGGSSTERVLQVIQVLPVRPLQGDGLHSSGSGDPGMHSIELGKVSWTVNCYEAHVCWLAWS